MRKVGLFGGSFNPPHLGHLKISQFAIKKFHLSKLFWLVVPKNPFKTEVALPLEKRINFCNKLIGKSKKMKAIDFESDLKTPETHNTIKKAIRKFPNTKLFWIMGTDNLFHFEKWKHAKFIARNIEFLIFPRNNFHKSLRTASYLKYRKKMHFLSIKKINISSTEIRKKIGINWPDYLNNS